MPQRVSSRREDCDEIQGEGSWVEITGLKVKEMKEQREQAEENRRALTAYNKRVKAHQKKQAEDPTLDDLPTFESTVNPLDYGLEKLRLHVIAWNWVDDDGNPLPDPKENPEVFDELTDDEVTFLINKMMGVDESKN